MNQRPWRVAKELRLALLFLLLCALPVTRAQAAEVNLWDRENPLFLYGFLHSEHSWTDATGNTGALADGLYRWDTEYQHDLRGSLILEGHLSRALRLDGSFLYDSRYAEDPNRVWDRTYWDHFRMSLDLDTVKPFWGRWSLNGSAKLSRDPNWRERYPDSRLLLEPVEELRLEAGLELLGPWAEVRAGDVQASLGPNDLTLYERNAFGLHGRLFSDRSEVDFLGARAKGEVFFQTPTDSLGIRADGTSGPYRLGHSPIIRGSETVWIEIRDRFDPTIVLQRLPQRRLLDYTVDYARGVLVFMEPVSSETFEDDPIYIAVQYGYDARDTGYERWLGASRGQAMISDGLTVGVTYAGEFDEAGTWKGEGERAGLLRHHAYGLDATVRLAEDTEIRAAYAMSDSGSWGQGNDNAALSVDLRSTTVDRLKVDGTYRRLEKDFDPISNCLLVGQRDKERWDVGAELAASDAVSVRVRNRTSRELEAGADGANLTDTSQLLGAGWTTSRGPDLDAEVEIRDVFDGTDRSTRNDRRTTGRLTAKDQWGRLDWRARYENERYDEKVDADGESETVHRFKLEPKLNAGRGLLLSGEGKLESHRDRRKGIFDERRSFLRTRAEYRLSDRFSALAAWERQDRFDQDSENFQPFGGDHLESEQGYSVGADWRIHRRVETRARVERQLTRNEAQDAALRESQTYRHQIFWYASRDLEFKGEFVHADLEDLRKIGVAGDGDRRIDNEILADVAYNYREDLSLTAGFNFHRRNLYNPGDLESWVRRVHVGGNGHLHRNLELTVEAQYAWLEGRPLAYENEDRMVENARLRLLTEIALDVRSHTRFALGYERLDYDEDSDPTGASDFDAHRGYLKMIGRF